MAQFVIEIKLDSNQDRNKDRKISIIVMGIRTRIMMINFFGKLGKFMPSTLYKTDHTIVAVVVVCHTWRPPVYCPLSRSRCLSSPRSRTACTGPSVRHTTNRYACKGILWVWHLWVCRSPQCGSQTIYVNAAVPQAALSVISMFSIKMDIIFFLTFCTGHCSNVLSKDPPGL